MAKQPLPVDRLEAALIKGLSKCRNFVIEAPTGSGKSTRIPCILDRSGSLDSGKIYVLQPRRVATRALALRISQESETRLGEYVGYQIRFDRKWGASTRIVFVTEGILFHKMLSDPQLSGVAAVIFDEFHERNQYSDLCLALARKLQRGNRTDLIIGVMSATVESERIRKFLDPCLHLKSDGSSYPVDIAYSAMPMHNGKPKPIWEHASEALSKQRPDPKDGSILVFMPGKFEINRTIRELENNRRLDGFEILALHGDLKAELQDAAIAGQTKAKIIVSTNIAETSLTIPGVTLVIDSGLARIPSYDPRRGINTLHVQPISQASATQRAGRAGRVAPGRAIRLWSEKRHHSLPPHGIPELHRIDISETLLHLIGAEYLKPNAPFPWFEPPTEQQLDQAFELLRRLGAVNANSELSEIGRKMAGLPMHPRFSRMFIEAEKHDCLRPISMLAAMSQEKRFVRNYDYDFDGTNESESSDLIYELRLLDVVFSRSFDRSFCERAGVHIVTARNILRIADQFSQMLFERGFLVEKAHETRWDHVPKCILLGFPDHVAKRQDSGTLRVALVDGKNGFRRKESSVNSEWLVALELEEQKVGNGIKILLGRNTPIESEWFNEYFSSDVTSNTTLYWDPTHKRIRKTETLAYRGIEMESKDCDSITETEAAETLAREIHEGTIKIRHWNHLADELIERIRFVAKHFPEYEIDDISEQDRLLLLEQFCLGARSEKDLMDRNILECIEDWLSPEQKPALESCAPENLKIPGKGRLTFRYENAEATVSGKIQQFYDLDPILIGDRVPVIYELLAPNNRPVQITRDIEAFWQTSYPAIKKELKGRYPKHEWR
jgi:ATP-dependent helicase HrpB